MWRHPEEGESTYIANYQNWALAKQIHTEEIDHEIDSIRPTSNLTELELANNLSIDQNWLPMQESKAWSNRLPAMD